MPAERTIITKSNLDEATAAELQRYMEDHGIVDLHMARRAEVRGWVYTAVLKDGTVLAGGPLPEMSDCMKALIQKLEEA